MVPATQSEALPTTQCIFYTTASCLPGHSLGQAWPVAGPTRATFQNPGTLADARGLHTGGVGASGPSTEDSLLSTDTEGPQQPGGPGRGLPSLYPLHWVGASSSFTNPRYVPALSHVSQPDPPGQRPLPSPYHHGGAFPVPHHVQSTIQPHQGPTDVGSSSAFLPPQHWQDFLIPTRRDLQAGTVGSPLDSPGE